MQIFAAEKHCFNRTGNVHDMATQCVKAASDSISFFFVTTYVVHSYYTLKKLYYIKQLLFGGEVMDSQKCRRKAWPPVGIVCRSMQVNVLYSSMIRDATHKNRIGRYPMSFLQAVF